MITQTNLDADFFNEASKNFFPAFVGVHITSIAENKFQAELAIQKHHLAPNQYLHAGVYITLADTLAGFSCVACLPAGAKSFTTIELKSNFIATAREGTLIATAKSEHLGRSTQIWDVEVMHKETGKKLALFRCTQMILY
ncbi:MAG: PaaI family thioesterase [Microscillaceae bacterium]|nr:PaaI family thioesterase [Microscillaceae bacterium]MDW8461239.1 PaaI family thioesterase [Cytophagales bacterium]